MAITQPIPLGLYIHLPWCEKKCPYCDFNSHSVTTEPPWNTYVDTLLADLRELEPWIDGREVHSIFIGGGTPSLIPAKELDRLLAGIRQFWPWPNGLEVTMEANPGSSEAGRFLAYQQSGVNRLSLGVQSFCDEHLRALGRVHDAKAAHLAVQAASKIFPRVNIDLIHGLPNQNVSQALADVDEALNLGVRHLSCYQLTLEPGTVFHRAPPPLPSPDLSADMGVAIDERLSHAGFEHYEISAFAKAQEKCRHNLNYWMFGDYLGIGAGAHSKLSGKDGKVWRSCKAAKPEAYMKSPAGKWWSVPSQDLSFEFMLNCLRLSSGVAESLFYERTGLPLDAITPILTTAKARGLLISSPQLQATSLGQRFLNDLLQLFINDNNEASSRLAPQQTKSVI